MLAAVELLRKKRPELLDVPVCALCGEVKNNRVASFKNVLGVA